jgi:Mn2+/Fe2+ NRAMP family transporter
MTNPSIVYPPLPADLERGFRWRSLKYFGAGAIIASVTIASGETLFGSRAGAIFGYSVLWCFVAGVVMKGVQVYAGMRYMVLTGQHPMTHWGRLPGPKNWVPLTIGLLSLICFPFWLAGLPLMLGNILNWVFTIDGTPDELLRYARFWATLTIAAAVMLVWFESYAFLERAQLLIVAILLGCMFVAVIAARPDWLAALVGIVTPRVPREYEPWIRTMYQEVAARPPWVEIMVYVGAIGGGTYDYIGYVGLMREKGWGAIGRGHDRYRVDAQLPATPLAIDVSDDNLRRGRRWLVPAQIDTGICFLSVLVFTACFALLGAEILRPQRLVPDENELFSYQAQFLTNLHPALLYVYQVGIFVAIFGTIYGAYEVYFRTAFECLMPISERIRQIPFQRFRRAIVLYCAAFGLLFLWTLEKPVEIVTPAAIVGGVFTCGLWCLAMLWTDRQFLPAPLRMPRLLWWLTAMSGVVLTLLGVKGIWDYAAKWFGG